MSSLSAITTSPFQKFSELAGKVSRQSSDKVESSFAENLGETKAADESKKAETKVDFSHMSCRELFGWINEQIRTGKMTLDESTNYVGLTLNGLPADGSWEMHMDEPQNYLAALKSGIEGARWRNDPGEESRLDSMLKRLLAEQDAKS